MIRMILSYISLLSALLIHVFPQDVNFTMGEEEEEENTNRSTNSIQYTAAVLEYEAFDDTSQGGLALLQQNARNYIEYATEAKKQGANIIVFPENGLTSSNTGATLDQILSRSQIVPEAADEIIPCFYSDAGNASKVMQQLSCGAMELQIYMVVQLTEQQCLNEVFKTNNETGSGEECPDADLLFYNTQVVFSDTGMVVAKYRKKHLYSEYHISKGEQPVEEAIFTTNFGVTFTLQICFDILYLDPAVSNIETYGLHDVILSTHWIDELPFLTAPQIWQAWSEGNRVNLLASNYFNPSHGALGSGIFRGYTSEPATYIYDADDGTTLVVGTVSSSVTHLPDVESNVRTIDLQSYHPAIIDRDNSSTQRFNTFNSEDVYEAFNCTRISSVGQTLQGYTADNQTFHHEDLRRYSHSVIEWSPTNSSNWTKTLCHEDSICCSVVYNYPQNSSEEGLFMLLAYSGFVEKGGGAYSMYSQVCSIVYCLDANVTSCAQIENEPVRYSTLKLYELKGDFGNHYIYPSVLMQTLELYNSNKWEFDVERHDDIFTGIVKFGETPNHLLSLTLFSRWYDRDTEIEIYR